MARTQKTKLAEFQMKKLCRLLAGILSLVVIVGWVLFIKHIAEGLSPLSGAGDNAVNKPESAGEEFFGTVIIGFIALLLVSPYLCTVAGAFNLIGEKFFPAAYVYSLIALALITLVMLGIPWTPARLIALANALIGGLWAYSGRSELGPKAEISADR